MHIPHDLPLQVTCYGITIAEIFRSSSGSALSQWHSLIVKLVDGLVSTRGGFYMLQSLKMYYKYQREFSNMVWALFGKLQNKKGRGNCEAQRPASYCKILSISRSRHSQIGIFVWNKTVTTARTVTVTENVPSALICIDKVRGLLGNTTSILFRLLREALRKRYCITKQVGNINLEKPQWNFFFCSIYGHHIQSRPFLASEEV